MKYRFAFGNCVTEAGMATKASPLTRLWFSPVSSFVMSTMTESAAALSWIPVNARVLRFKFPRSRRGIFQKSSEVTHFLDIRRRGARISGKWGGNVNAAHQKPSLLLKQTFSLRTSFGVSSFRSLSSFSNSSWTFRWISLSSSSTISVPYAEPKRQIMSSFELIHVCDAISSIWFSIPYSFDTRFNSFEAVEGTKWDFSFILELCFCLILKGGFWLFVQMVVRTWNSPNIMYSSWVGM